MDDPATFLGLDGHEWLVAIVGAALGVAGAVTLGAATGLGAAVLNWWRNRQPVHLLLQRLSDRSEPIHIYARDFESMVWDAATKTPKRVKLIVNEPLVGRYGEVDNVPTLWSRVEATAYGAVLYVLSVAGKTAPIEVIDMSKDQGRWDGGIVVLGAQTERCYQFYRDMKGVAFSMDEKNIYDQAGQPLDDPEIDEAHVNDYRYGIILKARNPYRTLGGPGTALLIGGFGVEGTEAAGYYFRTRFRELARDFGNRTFGVVIRVRGGANPETAVRVPVFDTATEKKPFWTRRLWEFLPFTRQQVDSSESGRP